MHVLPSPNDVLLLHQIDARENVSLSISIVVFGCEPIDRPKTQFEVPSCFVPRYDVSLPNLPDAQRDFRLRLLLHERLLPKQGRRR